MNILSVGGWFSGNSAILDYIDGYKTVNYVKSDFDILRKSNGIMDLIEEKDQRKKVRIINRIMSTCFRSLFIEVKFVIGRHTKYFFKSKEFHRDRQYKKRYHSSIIYNLLLINSLLIFKFLSGKMSNIEQIDFWKKWLVGSFGESNKKTIYCNPIYYDNFEPKHKKLWPQLLNPYKILLVHRDPLDQFCDMYNKGGLLDTSVTRFFSGTEKLDPIDRFHYIVKKIHKARLKLIRDIPSEQLLLVSFEDFIQKNTQTSEKVIEFLGLKNDEFISNNRFDINESEKNIRLWEHDKDVTQLFEKNKDIVDDIFKMRAELIQEYTIRRSC